MVLSAVRTMSRFQYGGASYWVLKRNVAGTYARRLMEMVELHFHESGSRLVLDLRQVPVVDSEGAHCLETLRRRHADLDVVGKPRDWTILPRSVRETLHIIRPAKSLEKALSAQGHVDFRQPWQERRRYHRIPVQIPVEIIFGGRSAVATMRDISLGGGRLGRFSARVMERGADETPFPELTIAGIDQDPLGREIISSPSPAGVATKAVYVLPGNSGMGVQFA